MIVYIGNPEEDVLVPLAVISEFSKMMGMRSVCELNGTGSS